MKYKLVSRGTLGLAMGIALSACLAIGQEQTPQQQPAPSPAPSPGPTTTAPTPTPSPLPTTRERQQPQFPEPRQEPFPEIQRPIFLSGKVVLDDGSPPPDSVVIERVCNGVPRPEGYTDSKGRFSIQLGQASHVMADASVSSADPGFGPMGGRTTQGGFGGFGTSRGVSERDLMGCELRASLPGYRSELVNLAGRRIMDNPDVGTIILRRLGNVEGLTTSATTLLAPKDARKAYEKGREEARKQKWDKAQKELEKAVQLYPKYAVAWYELGRVHETQKKPIPARDAYAKALAADGKYVNPYLQIALLDAREQKWQEVADTTHRVLQLNPFDFPAAYFYNSVANFNLRKLEEAEKSAREALKLDPQHRIPKVSHLLGVILAQQNELEEAVQHMRNYLEHSPEAADGETVKEQIAEMEKFLGKTEAAQQTPQQ